MALHTAVGRTQRLFYDATLKASSRNNFPLALRSVHTLLPIPTELVGHILHIWDPLDVPSGLQRYRLFGPL
ncbi:hypothetical protein M378DRAFT_173600 [Amanita muscaria Koide BX008]|uniref:Uncharacterized protein n=1 Tax=Amanita muscaria (strain Koide BX008) TaxID=946122 RepID=A0A0C2RYR0_AMAMK|nr:hypothetical protein M378DRAFT_173600 [Amanita muscaria Koide BX008]